MRERGRMREFLMPADPLVSNVSDTARWVAAYRAMESARPDALFRDPYADRLAGARGHAIAKKGPRSTRSGWPMIVRTRLIDDLVAASVAEGCDCVLNLAAGLDTRPYRMELPASLEWVEADLGPMVDEKEALMAGIPSHCALRRERVDLADRSARNAFLERATRGASHVLVLTEGLLVYLETTVVEAIARDLLAQPALEWWILDVNSPGILKLLRKGMGSLLENAPMKFGPANGVAFFEALGWRARDIRSFIREAARLRRGPWLLRTLASVLPDADARKPGNARWSAVVRFERG
jgi:methyltransferase (TIGR00027 family)